MLQNDRTILGQEFYTMNREFIQCSAYSINVSDHSTLVLKVSHQIVLICSHLSSLLTAIPDWNEHERRLRERSTIKLK